MQQKVETYIQKQQLLTHNLPVIVGVSGGTDSVVLLHILLSLGYKCIMAHCNFHLRKDESCRDEAFVRKLETEYKIPTYYIDFETIKYADTHGISVEMAARDLRYNWFEELRQKHNAQAVAVAHHADDNIETLLINLIRGTGIRGLKGMPVRNENVVRPLLFLARTEIENYLILHSLEHVEDSTNTTSDYTRNKIRNEVLPLLTEINPSIHQTLYSSIERFEGNLIIYEQAIENIKRQIVHKTDEVIKMDIATIFKQIDVSTIMYELLHPYSFTPATIKQIISQLNAESGRVFYSETHRLLKDRNYLIISEKGYNKQNEIIVSHEHFQMSFPFELRVNKLSLDENFKLSKNKNRVQLDATKLIFPLTIRRWKVGDSFFPLGMKNRKKVSDFFIDNKLNLFEKEQSWILLSGDEIVWIMGQRIDNRFKVSIETKLVIEFYYNDL